MPTKLFYFDARNLAEPIRMAFHYGDEKFEDVRIQFSEWPQWKGKMPYGTIPVLDVDGKMLGESTAILRYVARKHGLAGKTDWDQAKIDELSSIKDDFYKAIMPWLFSAVGLKEPEKKDERYESVGKPVLAKYLTIYEDILKQNSSGFLVGDHESFVDFQIAEFVFSLNGLAPEILKDYPKLLEHVKHIHNLPQLKSYIANRKSSPI